MPAIEKVTFNNRTSREFGKTVKQRVDQYFDESGISKNANSAMVVKTILLLTLYMGGICFNNFRAAISRSNVVPDICDGYRYGRNRVFSFSRCTSRGLLFK